MIIKQHMHIYQSIKKEFQKELELTKETLLAMLAIQVIQLDHIYIMKFCLRMNILILLKLKLPSGKILKEMSSSV